MRRLSHQPRSRPAGASLVRRPRSWALGLWVLVAGCGESYPDRRQVGQGEASTASEVRVKKRSGVVKAYPCSQCHQHVDEQSLTDMADGRKHAEINPAHFDGSELCVTCHSVTNMDEFRLLTGFSAPFDDAQLLCGQCHSERLADWKIGAHGKSVGDWDGVRFRLVCTECHDPHRPSIAPMQARPAPPRPVLGIAKEAH